MDNTEEFIDDEIPDVSELEDMVNKPAFNSVHNRKGELLGYTIRFPIHPEFLGKSYSLNFPQYGLKGAEYRGTFVFDKNSRFVGTVYDADSKIAEFAGGSIGRIIVLYYKKNNASIVISVPENANPVKALLRRHSRIKAKQI